MPKSEINVTLKFVGDQFPHAWYFNRFRCDVQGPSILVTTALITAGGGTPAVNGFVISRRDLELTKQRSEKYFQELSGEFDAEEDAASELLIAPTRVYPINYINLSRIDEVGEMSLYRYSMHTMLTEVRKGDKAGDKAGVKAPADKIAISCYPVVMFRSEVTVQISLLKDLFSL
jgi:hypothetical protein